MSTSPEVRAYLAAIGTKGGTSKNARKGFGSATPEARRSAQRKATQVRKNKNRP